MSFFDVPKTNSFINEVFTLHIQVFNLTTFLCIFLFIIQAIISCFIFNTEQTAKFSRISMFITYITSFLLLGYKLYILNLTKLSAIIPHSMFSEKLMKYTYLYEANFYTSTSFGNFWILSTCLALLCIFSSLICTILLGDRQLIKSINNSFIFSVFLICILIMISTTNLFVIYLMFEFIFLPTVFFSFYYGYVQKINQAVGFLVTWTLVGSLSVLGLLCYVYYTYNVNDLVSILGLSFTETELTWFFVIIFFGMGAKIPLFPFHFWLTKVHVEASAGFSIFLSGFLVKTAFFVFTLFCELFLINLYKALIFIILIFGIIDASLRFWTQTDLKKVIALATIQEMNMLFLIWLINYNTYVWFIAIFLLMHGVLSSLLFFYADLLQKHAQTRNISILGGFISESTSLLVVTWLIIFFFSGFPLTIKFIIEYVFFILMLELLNTWCVIVLLLIICFGLIGFIRHLLIIMYGSSITNLKKYNANLSLTDVFIFILLIFSYLILIFFL